MFFDVSLYEIELFALFFYFWSTICIYFVDKCLIEFFNPIFIFVHKLWKNVLGIVEREVVREKFGAVGVLFLYFERIGADKVVWTDVSGVIFFGRYLFEKL